MVKVLEEIPNNVIPTGSVTCEITTFSNTAPLAGSSTHSTGHEGHTYTYLYKMALWNDLVSEASGLLPMSWDSTNDNLDQTQVYTGSIYRLKMTGNPGNLKTPEVELYLDGKAPSLISATATKKVVTFVSTDGQGGEDDDYFADHCDGVTVTIPATSGSALTDKVTLAGLTNAEKKLLKVCLGDADGDDSTNYDSAATPATQTDVENWDHGSDDYPHLIKLVRTVTSYQDGGYYAALIFDGTNFNLMNPFIPLDTLVDDNYDIYTTKGTFKRTISDAAVTAGGSTLFGFGQRHVVTTVKDHQVAASTALWSGNLGCEALTATDAAQSVTHCLNRSDLFTVLAPMAQAGANPPYINLYTAKRIWTTPYKVSAAANTIIQAGSQLDEAELQLQRGIHIIETDLGMNWGGDDAVAQFAVYKFVPAEASTYNYVAPCSNRGICNEESGVCACFPGYTNDNCDTQNSLAL